MNLYNANGISFSYYFFFLSLMIFHLQINKHQGLITNENEKITCLQKVLMQKVVCLLATFITPLWAWDNEAVNRTLPDHRPSSSSEILVSFFIRTHLRWSDVGQVEKHFRPCDLSVWAWNIWISSYKKFKLRST